MLASGERRSVSNVCTEKSKMTADTYGRPFTDYPFCDCDGVDIEEKSINHSWPAQREQIEFDSGGRGTLSTGLPE